MCHVGCIQVCLEGQISRNSALQSLQMGRQPPGDQIPWKFCQVFRDTDFPSLSGARVVRIAVHPSALRVSNLISFVLVYNFLLICKDSCYP